MHQRRPRRYRNFRRAYADHREADERGRRAAGMLLLAGLAAAVLVVIGVGLWFYEGSRAAGDGARRRAADHFPAPSRAPAADSAAAADPAPEEVLIN